MLLNPLQAAGVLALAALPIETVTEAPGENAALAATIAFKATKLHLGDGRVLENGVILVEQGVIRTVGADLSIPEGTTLIEHEGAITPGLIALHSHDGGGGELFETARQVLPEAELVWAFDPDSRDFERALAAGITSIVLAPTNSSLCPGITAVVKAHGGKVVDPSAQLVLGFSSRSLRGNEFPTSHASAQAELDRLFDLADGAFGRAAGGNLEVLLDVEGRDEIQRALAFAQRRKLKGALNGSHWTEELAESIQAAGLAVVCDAADAGQDARSQRSVLALAKAGVPFGFGLGAPYRSPESLRFAAALAIRAGLEPERALQALTGDAARIAGASGRIGTLASGLDADLVLWSGDPTDLGSHVIAVYVDGVRAHGDEE